MSTFQRPRAFAIFVEGRYQLTFLDEESGGNAVIRVGVQLGS